MILPIEALAQTTATWTGGGDGISWSDPNNWDIGVVPNNNGTTYDAAISGNTVTLDQNFAIETLSISSSTLNGPGDLTLRGASDWTSSFLEGTGTTTIDPNGSMAFGSLALRRMLVNDGVVTLDTNSLVTYLEGTFQNNGTYTANPSGTQTSRGDGGVNTFNNAGTFVKQGSGTTVFRAQTTDVAFNNSGMVNIQAGRLQLQSGGTHTGEFTIASGADMVFYGDHVFSGSSDINGPGIFYISGDTSTFNGTHSIDVLDFETGTFDGTGNVTINDSFTWTDGTMTGSGQTTVGSGATVLFDGGNSDTSKIERTLIIDGTTTWTGGWLGVDSAILQNNGVFTANHSSGNFSGFNSSGAAFNNAGTFIKQGGNTTHFSNAAFFNNSGTVDVQAGNLSLGVGGSHSGSFTVASGAILDLSGDHTFTGTNSISGAGTPYIFGGSTTISFDGTTTVEGLTFSNGTIDGVGSLVLQGTSTWGSAIMESGGETTVDTGATLQLTGDQFATSTLRRLLTNNGDIEWIGGWIGMTDGTIQNNGTFTDQGTGNGAAGGTGTNVFHNAGSYVKLGTSNTSWPSGIVFNNTGTVDVQAGVLGLQGGTHTGTFSVAMGADLDLSGTHSFPSGTTISGAGTLNVFGGSTVVTFDGNSSVQSLDFTNGIIDGEGTLTLNGNSTWSSAIMSGSGQTIIPVGGSMEFTGDVFATSTLGRQLTIDGTATWSGGWIGLTDGTIQNNGTFTDQGTGEDATGGTGTNFFYNAGSYVKQGAGTTHWGNGITFNNTGTVDVQAGNLVLQGGGTHTGNFSVAAGAGLDLTGAHSFPSNTTISGAGTVQVVGGSTVVTFDGASSIETLYFSQGVIDGSGTLALLGSSIWESSIMSGTGQTTVAIGGSLDITGDSFSTATLRRQLTIDGTANWTGGWIGMSDGAIQNNGTFNDQGTGNGTNGSTGTNLFHNAGNYVKQGTSTIHWSSGIAFNNTGTVDVQQGGLVLQGGGTHSGDFTVAAGTYLDFHGDHVFTGNSNITGSGTFSSPDGMEIDSGTVTVAPTFTEFSSSSLTGGTWRVLNDSTLTISSGTNITNSSADITITGSGSSFPRIDTLVNNSGSFEIADGYDFTATGLFTNSGSLTVRNGSAFTSASGIVQTSTGSFSGDGSIVGNLTNSGTIRPGNSPGILNIDGDFTLTGSSTLEIEVAGLDPNVPEFDQVIATGTASLDGRLDIPIISGFVPTVNDEAVFLKAASVTGEFSTVRSIGLEAANPNIAIDLVQSGADVRIVFVSPDPNISFASTDTVATWNDPNTWTTGSLPETENQISIDNLAGSNQRVNIQSDDAFAHELTLTSTTNTFTLGITGSNSLSAIAGTEIGNQAAIELDSGTVVTPTVDVMEGGELSGNGTVIGTLVVGDGASGKATLSPGLSVGHIDVEGDYQQQSNGAILLEIDDPNTFDTIAITGSADLDGSLEITLADANAAPVGTVFEVITTGGITGTFDQVVTLGADDVVLVPSYGSSLLVSTLEFEALTGGGSIYLNSTTEGDMDPFTPGIGEEDAVAFALALTDPETYRNTYGISADEMGDIDDQNGIDFDDIDDFVKLLNQATGGSLTMTQMFRIIEEVQAVPEPNTLILLMGCVSCLICRRRRDLQ